jgi:predicted CopG family antitoxin
LIILYVYLCMNTQMSEMGYKNISISEEVYRRLRKAKRDNESFNEVISRLLGPDDDIIDLFGTITMSDEEKDEFLKNIDEMWGAWQH